MTEDYKILQSNLSDQIFIFCLGKTNNVHKVKQTTTPEHI